MRIGINGNRLVRAASLPAVTEHALSVARDGFSGYWLSQDPVGGFDSLTALTAIASIAPNVDLGTCVIPIWPRHPAALAAQALTVHQATGERLRLGIGLSHKAYMEQLGIEYIRPAEFMREYLDILMPLLDGEAVEFAGKRLRTKAVMQGPVAKRPDVLVAALGPQMLDIVGRKADGTIVTWTGPKSIREHVRPLLDDAAAKAGRPRPRVVAIVSVGASDDAEAARDSVDAWYAAHGQAPSYTEMLKREGAERPADIQPVGSPDQVLDRLNQFVEAGVDEFVVGEVATMPDAIDRTRALLIQFMRNAQTA